MIINLITWFRYFAWLASTNSEAYLGSCQTSMMKFFQKKKRLKKRLTKRLWNRCFPVNFAKFLRTPFLQNTSGRLLLFFPIIVNGFRIFSKIVNSNPYDYDNYNYHDIPTYVWVIIKELEIRMNYHKSEAPRPSTSNVNKMNLFFYEILNLR